MLTGILFWAAWQLVTLNCTAAAYAYLRPAGRVGAVVRRLPKSIWGPYRRWSKMPRNMLWFEFGFDAVFFAGGAFYGLLWLLGEVLT